MALSDTNVVIISGRLTRDPEPRGGGKVAALSVASNRYFRKNGDNSSTEEVCFVDVTAFGFEAENALSKLMKGAPVQIEGRLELNRWQNAEGENRQQLRIVANRITSPSLRSKAASEPVEDEEQPAEAQEAELVTTPAGDDDIPF